MLNQKCLPLTCLQGEERVSKFVALLILNLASGWRSVVNTGPRPLYSQERALYPLCSRLGRTQGRFGWMSRTAHLFLLQGFQLRTVSLYGVALSATISHTKKIMVNEIFLISCLRTVSLKKPDSIFFFPGLWRLLLKISCYVIVHIQELVHPLYTSKSDRGAVFFISSSYFLRDISGVLTSTTKRWDC
jgi:hypothetical protein